MVSSANTFTDSLIQGTHLCSERFWVFTKSLSFEVFSDAPPRIWLQVVPPKVFSIRSRKSCARALVFSFASLLSTFVLPKCRPITKLLALKAPHISCLRPIPPPMAPLNRSAMAGSMPYCGAKTENTAWAQLIPLEKLLTACSSTKEVALFVPVIEAD